MADAGLSRVQTLAEQGTLALFAGAALASFGLSRGFALWPLLLALPLVTLRLRLRRLPAGLATAVSSAVTIVLLATVVVGFVVALYPVIPERTTTALIRAFGAALSGSTLLFLAGTSIWKPGRGVALVSLGLLLAVAVDARELAPDGTGIGLLLLSFAGATGWLVASKRALEAGPALPGRPRAGLAAFAAGALAVALGIARLLPWAQPKVETAAAGLFAENQGRSYSGLSAQSRLGDIEELALSPRVVLRVWSSRPQNLRARVLTAFDGRKWSTPRTAESALAPAPPLLDRDLREWLEDIPGTTFLASPLAVEGADAERAMIRTRIVPVVPSLPLLSPPRARFLRAPVAVRVTTTGLFASSGSAEIYGIVNPPLDELDPASPGTASPAEDEAALGQALVLPTVVDTRLRALAAELGAGDVPPESRLRRTIGHFQAGFRYSLKVGAFRTRDPIAEFVFEKKRGYCEYFASAAALLLRLQGVPTRYVTGFSVRSANFTAGHYLVREADAHAWIEAYLPGQGWVEADPTPSGDYDEVHAGLQGGPVSAGLEWLKARWAEAAARLRGGGFAAALRWLGRELGRLASGARVVPGGLLIGLLVVGVAAYRWRGLLQRRDFGEGSPQRDSLPQDLRELIRRLDRAWARRGCPRPPSRAPLEHLRELPADKASPALRALATELLGSVYGVLFAGQAYSPADGARLRRMVEQIEREPLGGGRS